MSRIPSPSGNSAAAASTIIPAPATTPGPPSNLTPGHVGSDGPTVVSLKRFGYHAQPTVLVLTFNESLDPSTASDAANYRIVPIGPHGKSGHAIAIDRIDYDSATRSVTLRPSRRLNVHDRFELIVNGTSRHAVVDLRCHALDGGKAGKPGSDYVGAIDWSAIDGPSLAGDRYAKAWRKLVASGVVGQSAHA